MTEVTEAKGSCVCGGVRVTARDASRSLGACHCTTCRKWGGGPFLSVDCGSDVSFEGAENVATYDSSGWAQRGFCKVCGTHLFYRLKGPGQYFMPVGLFDQGPEPVFDHQIFIDSKPAYYQFANETQDMTGAEVFARFPPPAD